MFTPRTDKALERPPEATVAWVQALIAPAALTLSAQYLRVMDADQAVRLAAADPGLRHGPLVEPVPGLVVA